MKNLIFYSGKLDIRAGGPSGYLANLKKGIELIGNDDIKFLTVNTQEEVDKKLMLLSKLLTFWIPFERTRKIIRLKVLNALGGGLLQC